MGTKLSAALLVHHSQYYNWSILPILAIIIGQEFPGELRQPSALWRAERCCFKPGKWDKRHSISMVEGGLKMATTLVKDTAPDAKDQRQIEHIP